jgi:hypothetical protein
MRAVECPVPSCGHIHAPSDEARVDESGYSDKKHAKQSFGDFLTDSASKAN